MDDVAPELLAQVQRRFEHFKSLDPLIRRSEAAVAAGDMLTFAELDTYAAHVGDCLAKAFEVITPGKLPNGRMYYNIAERLIPPMMRSEYDTIMPLVVQSQAMLNRAAGLGIRPQAPPVDESRINNLVGKISSYEHYSDAEWLLDEPMRNFAQNVVDRSVRANAEFQHAAGVKVRMRRTAWTRCCDWCADLVGEYVKGKEPEDFWRRHERCRCHIEYDPGTGSFETVNNFKKIKSKK